MSSQKVISGNVIHNDGATIIYAGNIGGNSRVTNPVGLTLVGYKTGRIGSQIPAALSDATIAANTAGAPEPESGRSKAPTYKPVSSGNYAKMSPGVYVARTLATTLAGVANTGIYYGASDYNRKARYNITYIRTTFLSGYSWSVGSNGLTSYSATISNRGPIANSYGPDDEGTVDRAMPGELAYMYGAKTAQLADYPARTG